MPSFYGAHRGQDPRARARRSEKRHGERQTRRCSLARLIESEHDARATFFVLGWIAERQRELVREIAERGHEIASHGFDHRRVTTLTRDEFRESVRTSKRILEDVTGQAVFGYRAPNFSIVRGGEWALEILLGEGYRYDSSLFPGRRGGAGFVGGERDPHRLELASGTLHEILGASGEELVREVKCRVRRGARARVM